MRAFRSPGYGNDPITDGFLADAVIDDQSELQVRWDWRSPGLPDRQALEKACSHAAESAGLTLTGCRVETAITAAPTFDKTPVPGISNIIAVAGGKGGVGKSTTCINLAVAAAQEGARVGILDCDLYGPSLPSLIGTYERAEVDENGRIRPFSIYGLKAMSMGFLADPGQALLWRGPMLHKMLQEMVFRVQWGSLDYLFLDLPPGTGDIQLSLTGTVPISGAVLVTTPQKVALRDSEKGFAMFSEHQVPVLGIVENMAWFRCENCDKKHPVFKSGGGQKLADRHESTLLASFPMDPSVPAVLGRGEPFMVRYPKSEIGELYRHTLLTALGCLAQIGWGNFKPSAGGMEV